MPNITRTANLSNIRNKFPTNMSNIHNKLAVTKASLIQLSPSNTEKEVGKGNVMIVTKNKQIEWGLW